MIPKDHITAWRAYAPWAIDAQVEQDLVISRALVEMFCVPELVSRLLLRGGTALYKLYFTSAVRYSEDIDLVQAQPEPIGETIDYYQRKKGRDLFDLWHALDTNQATPSVMIACLKRYMSESGQAVSRAQFEENLAGKRNRHDFREDIEPLLRPGVTWDFDVAMNTVLERIIAELPGDPWKGPSE